MHLFGMGTSVGGSGNANPTRAVETMMAWSRSVSATSSSIADVDILVDELDGLGKRSTRGRSSGTRPRFRSSSSSISALVTET